MGNQLAIDGGPKAVTNKLQGWPQFDENAIKAVEAVLRSGKVITGPASRAWSSRNNSPNGRAAANAVSVATGTAALHVALGSLGIGPGDEVIVPSTRSSRAASLSSRRGPSPGLPT